jgi:ligand-binding SRPBCC domain-containing protein
MNLCRLDRRQIIRRPLEEVFVLFVMPENVGLLTPRSMDVQLLTPSPITMKERALMEYRLTETVTP